MAEFKELIRYVNQRLIDDLPHSEMLRLVEEVSHYRAPTFLVSMTLHRNLACNEQALQLMDATPEQLWARSLPRLWVPPSQLKPVIPQVYEANLPSHLQEMHQLLRQQSELINHKYCNWRTNGEDTEATWVRWTSDIKYREVRDDKDQIHPMRIMVCWGFDEV